jgi:hypothetical protein
MIPLLPFIPLGIGLFTCFDECQREDCCARLLRDQGIYLVVFEHGISPLLMGRN